MSQLQNNTLSNPDFVGGANTSGSLGAIMPMSFSDAGENQFNDINDTVNQMSIDQAVLEEAPLPESMEKKRSARLN